MRYEDLPEALREEVEHYVQTLPSRPDLAAVMIRESAVDGFTAAARHAPVTAAAPTGVQVRIPSLGRWEATLDQQADPPVYLVVGDPDAIAVARFKAALRTFLDGD